MCPGWKAVHDALVRQLVLRRQTTDEAMGMLVRSFPRWFAGVRSRWAGGLRACLRSPLSTSPAASRRRPLACRRSAAAPPPLPKHIKSRPSSCSTPAGSTKLEWHGYRRQHSFIVCWSNCVCIFSNAARSTAARELPATLAYVTPTNLSITQHPLSITQRALSITQRALCVT